MVSEGTMILLLNSEENKKEKTKAVLENQNNNIENKNEIIDFPEDNKKEDVQLISEGKVKPASPNVRKFIRELGADISKISGSKRLGRIDKNDVKDYVKNKLIDTPETLTKKKN